MAKVMLVEDDNNLREIYEARLQAEGYEIVSARDGEEALVVAKQEKPDLIISDVMMPKISGFEMLDILRNTDGMKDVKVVMLTALGQSDDKDRADKLGADRYLVKSQVTLEDIVKSAHDLLGGGEASAAPAPPTTPPSPTTDNPAPTPPVSNPPVDPPAEPPVEPPASEQTTGRAAVPEPVAVQAASPVPAPQPEPVVTPAPAPDTSTDDASTLITQSTAEEEASVKAQIDDFVGSEPAPTPAPASLGVDDSAAQSEAPAPTPTDAERDQVMSAAVDNLVASTATTESPKETPENQASDTAPEAPSAASQTTAPAPPPPEPSNPQPQADTNQGSVKIANKKVIQPIGNPTNQPDLNTLLAMEDAKSQAEQTAQQSGPSSPPPVPPQPNVSQPANNPPAQPGPNPNDIAL